MLVHRARGMHQVSVLCGAGNQPMSSTAHCSLSDLAVESFFLFSVIVRCHLMSRKYSKNTNTSRLCGSLWGAPHPGREGLGKELVIHAMLSRKLQKMKVKVQIAVLFLLHFWCKHAQINWKGTSNATKHACVIMCPPSLQPCDQICSWFVSVQPLLSTLRMLPHRCYRNAIQPPSHHDAHS